MKILLSVALATALSLSACSRNDGPPAPSAAASAQTYELVANTAKGFSVGPMMSANTVYVLFDPQCPHCGHLWQSVQPLLGQVKFVWAPVAFINGNSAPQGAALLTAGNPSEAMTLHEASLLAGKGGMVPMAGMAAEQEAVIRKNTELLNQLKAESVPFLVARKAGSGEVITHTGALDTAALGQWLGLAAQ